MSIENRGTQFTPETAPPRVEITRTERDLNEIIPILAHGLVRRIEQKGFAGKVRVSAMAGEEWGVAKTPDNPTDIPNVIVYPREYLSGDKRVVNARLRHEIGNLNYPIDGELNTLRDWCKTRHIAPELLTALTEATNEASVNYLEMQNSHSSQPEQNFKALYEQEIDTGKIVSGISEAAPYKQAIDVTLLYTLSQTGLAPKEQFEQALSNAHPAVREVFDKQTRSLLDQAVKIAVPKKKVQLVRDYLWPKFSKLVGLPSPSRGVVPSEQEKSGKKDEEQASQAGEESSEQLEGIKEKLEQMAEQMESGEEEPGDGSGESGEPSTEEGEGGGGDGQGKPQAGQPDGGMGAGAGEAGGESGGGMPSAQEMQEFLSQMEESLNQAKEVGQGGAGGAGQEAIEQLLEQVAQMQKDLASGAKPKDIAKQIKDALEKLKEAMKGMGGKEPVSGEHEISTEKLSGGKSDEAGFEKAKVQDGASEYNPDQQGGAGNTVEGEGIVFSRPDPKLLEQLRALESSVGSKFTKQDEQGNFVTKESLEDIQALTQLQLAEIEAQQTRQLSSLENLKREQQTKAQALYKEMSGLDGEALKVYTEYMESMRELIDDLTDFFIEKFNLDREYIYERHQRRGARLQRGFTQNILGQKGGRTVISPRSFERRRVPELPKFVWTIIVDNTGSVGEMIEDEKKLAVALIEVTKRLDIPFEIVIYTEGGYMFLKQFDQEALGEDLQKIVLLKATIGNQQDTDLLNAAYASQTRYSDQFKRTHNFVFFLTDGLACSADSLHDMVNKFKKETVILGVGLAQGAATIKKEFGKNALEVPDSKQLSTKFIGKIEDLVDQTFD